MLESGTRILAVGLALILSSSTANAVWSINMVGSSYMSGATIPVSGAAAPGVATVQQEYSKTYGSPGSYIAFGNAPACTVTGAYWNQSFTATVADPAANCYHVKLAKPQGGFAVTNTYTVF